MWMPWSQRSCVFHIRHVLSPLHASVVDYDILGGHEGIGRAKINLNHFESNMVYTLKYTLYPSSNTWDREGAGTITTHLCKKIIDENKLLMKFFKAFTTIQRQYVEEDYPFCCKLHMMWKSQRGLLWCKAPSILYQWHFRAQTIFIIFGSGRI